MGITQAWVEAQETSQDIVWYPQLNALPFLSNGQLVLSFFGADSASGFHPVVPVRGLPSNISDQVRSSFERRERPSEEEELGASWISWREAKAIDWEVPEALPERRMLRYPIAGGVEYVADSQAASIAWFSRRFGYNEAELLASWQPGHSWGLGDSLYMVEGKRRKDYRDEGWRLLADTLAFLARLSGDDGVRLIIGWVQEATRKQVQF
jgi:hypothetical protein